MESSVSGIVFHQVLVANVTEERMTLSFRDFDGSADIDYHVVDWADQGAPTRTIRAPFEMKLPTCGTRDFHLYQLSPAAQTPLVGEKQKFVPVSGVRFKKVSSKGATLLLAGAETVTVSVVGQDDIVVHNDSVDEKEFDISFVH